MACYQPKEIYDYGEKTNSGKTKYEFLYNPKKIAIATIEIPCGKCTGCIQEYSIQWTKRIMFEATKSTNNYFITLTYDNENVPKHASLKKEHISKFIKDLRRHFEYHYGHTGIRFFGSGEYGEKTRRPHYHLIIFNLPIKDLEYWRTTKIGDIVFKSKTIEKVWGKGLEEIGELNSQTASYTARYTLKKCGKQWSNEYYEKNHLEKEFSLMSRRPGIGEKYYQDKNKEIYENDEVIYKDKNGKAIVSKPPRYFDKLKAEENEQFIKKLKANRMKSAIHARTITMQKTTLDRHEYNYQLEEAKKETIKNLKKLKNV